MLKIVHSLRLSPMNAAALRALTARTHWSPLTLCALTAAVAAHVVPVHAAGHQR